MPHSKVAYLTPGEHPVKNSVAASARRKRRGLALLFGACIAYAATDVLITALARFDPSVSGLTVSITRLSISLLTLGIFAIRTGPREGLWGDGHRLLWLRGFFGAIALMTSVLAVRSLGVGDASFLLASDGVFVVLLTPLVLRKKVSMTAWASVMGAMVGLFLLYQPRLGDISPWGRTLALFSGLCTALSYLVIARSGLRAKTRHLIFYASAVGAAAHLPIVWHGEMVWPSTFESWICVGFGGLFSSVGAFLVTAAYQRLPTEMAAAGGYLSPVLKLVAGIALFGVMPDGRGVVGVLLVLFCSIAAPFAMRGRTGSHEVAPELKAEASPGDGRSDEDVPKAS